MPYDLNNVLLVSAFILDVALAGYLIYHDRKSAENISFAAVILSLALWAISYVFWSMAERPRWIKLWIDMTFFSTALMPACFLYFALVFPGREFVKPKGLPAVFIPAIVFGAASFTTLIGQNVTPPYIEPSHGEWYFFFISYLIAYLGYSFYIILNKYFRAKGRERIQIQYMMLGTLITALIGIFTNIFLVSRGVMNFGPLMVNAIGPASTVIMVAFVTYAIVRHSLLGVEYIFSRAFVYLVLFSFTCLGVIAFATNNVKDIIYTYTILANISLGFFVFINAPRRKMNRVFLMFTFVIAAWTLSVMMFRLTGDIVWGRIIYAAATFIPPVFISFVRFFPKELNRKEQMSHIIVYLFGIVFFFLSLNGQVVNGVTTLRSGYGLLAGPSYSLIYMYFAAGIGLGFFELYFNYKNAKGISRMQVKYLYLGTFLATLGGLLTGIIMPVLGYPEFSVIGPPCFLIMLAFLTYSILKHRLMSVEMVVQKSFIYIIITALVLFIYFFSEYVLREAIGYSSIVSTVFTALITAIIYNPLLNTLQDFTDSVFFREKYNSHRILGDTSKKVSAILRLEEIVKMVASTFIETMKISEVSFLMRDDEKQKFRSIPVNLGPFQSFYKKIETSETNPIINWLKEKGGILVRDEVEAEHAEIGLKPHAEMDDLNEELERLEFAIWVPIFLDEELAAVICLGYKLSGDMYTDEDIDLLEMLSHQLAVALENSIMYMTINRQYEELKTTKDKLMQADKLASLGNMAAGMAHEIKNPLSSMKVFSQLLNDRYEDAEFRKKFLDVIPKEINRIDRIVEGLISFAKSPEPQLGKTDVAALIDEVLEDHKEDIEQNSIKVEKEYLLVPMILADKDQLMRAFGNIILNAVQAVGANGELKISISAISQPAEMVQIKISDNGSGISSENMKHLFDPFFTTKHYGTGLGLAITHSIIEGHKGNIEIESVSAHGTTVTVTLPVNMRMI